MTGLPRFIWDSIKARTELLLLASKSANGLFLSTPRKRARRSEADSIQEVLEGLLEVGKLVPCD